MNSFANLIFNRTGLVPVSRLQVYRRSLSLLAPQSLTTQVPDQRIFTGSTPEWSDFDVPVLVGTRDLPVIKGQVLGLPFLAAI